MNIYFTPSFYAHIFNGLLFFIASIIFLLHYKKFTAEPYKLITLLLLFSIVAGVHGLSHLGLETVYNYNPLSTFIN